jgi:hypothetical protein
VRRMARSPMDTKTTVWHHVLPIAKFSRDYEMEDLLKYIKYIMCEKEIRGLTFPC